MERKSLIDDSMQGVGVKGAGGAKGKGKGGSTDTIKVAAAVAVLVIGLGLIGWSQGLFDGFLKPKREDPMKSITAEQKAQIQKAEKDREKLEKQIPPSGS